jgi:hypothetical protein
MGCVLDSFCALNSKINPDTVLNQFVVYELRYCRRERYLSLHFVGDSPVGLSLS